VQSPRYRIRLQDIGEHASQGRWSTLGTAQCALSLSLRAINPSDRFDAFWSVFACKSPITTTVLQLSRLKAPWLVQAGQNRTSTHNQHSPCFAMSRGSELCYRSIGSLVRGLLRGPTVYYTCANDLDATSGGI
jgi:hypothetical protein